MTKHAERMNETAPVEIEDAALDAASGGASGVPGLSASSVPGVSASSVPGVSASGVPGVSASGVPGVSASSVPGFFGGGVPGGPTPKLDPKFNPLP